MKYALSFFSTLISIGCFSIVMAVFRDVIPKTEVAIVDDFSLSMTYFTPKVFGLFQSMASGYANFTKTGHTWERRFLLETMLVFGSVYESLRNKWL